MAPENGRRRMIVYGAISGVVLFGTFALDLLTPFGVGLWALYPFAILSAMRWGGRAAIGTTTALALLLTVSGAWLSPYEEVDWTHQLLAAVLISLVGVICAQLQITDRALRQAQALQSESEIRLSSVLHSATDAIVLADSEGGIVSWNHAASKIFGYDSQEVIGRPLTVLIPDRYREAHRKGLARVQATGESKLVGKTIEIEGLRKDGAEFPLELSLSMWKTKGNTFFSGIIRDLTVRRRNEQDLAVQYAVTRVLAVSASVVDATSNILQSVCETIGWEVGAIWVIEKDGRALRCAALWHRPGVDVGEFESETWHRTFARGVGLPGRVWASGEPAWITDVSQDANFPRIAMARKAGLHGAFAFPILSGGEVTGVTEFFSREVRKLDEGLVRTMHALGGQMGQFIARKNAEAERERLLGELQDALSSIKTLHGLLPICASCKKVRDDAGYWNRIEDYLKDRSSLDFTHGICPECAKRIHPEWDSV
jgi:PAS domain S-box-containing protein